MSFQETGLSEKVLSAVEAAGYTTPTPIQAGAIPALLDGHDLLGIAQTGTGKTAAFSIPLLQRMVAPANPEYADLPADAQGKPQAIVQNLAGAGSYLAYRRVFSIAPQDGTVLGSIGAALPYQPLIDPAATQALILGHRCLHQLGPAASMPLPLKQPLMQNSKNKLLPRPLQKKEKRPRKKPLPRLQQRKPPPKKPQL